jgi:transcriptional regulator of acetoin/glycerol metabolism
MEDTLGALAAAVNCTALTDLLTRPENTVASIARLLGVSRNTIYKYLPEISSARALPDADIPAQTAPAP